MTTVKASRGVDLQAEKILPLEHLQHNRKLLDHSRTSHSEIGESKVIRIETAIPIKDSNSNSINVSSQLSSLCPIPTLKFNIDDGLLLFKVPVNSRCLFLKDSYKSIPQLLLFKSNHSRSSFDLFGFEFFSFPKPHPRSSSASFPPTSTFNL